MILALQLQHDDRPSSLARPPSALADCIALSGSRIPVVSGDCARELRIVAMGEVLDEV